MKLRYLSYLVINLSSQWRKFSEFYVETNKLLHARYERFVSALEEASRDMLPILKDKALKVST